MLIITQTLSRGGLKSDKGAQPTLSRKQVVKSSIVKISTLVHSFKI